METFDNVERRPKPVSFIYVKYVTQWLHDNFIFINQLVHYLAEDLVTGVTDTGYNYIIIEDLNPFYTETYTDSTRGPD